MIQYSTGQQVEVQFNVRSNYLFRESDYETHTIKGTITRTPSWVEYPAIAVLTDLPDFPLSIIPLGSIVGNVATDQADYDVRAYTEGGYIVTIINKQLNCTCTGFQFRKFCKHSSKHKQ